MKQLIIITLGLLSLSLSGAGQAVEISVVKKEVVVGLQYGVAPTLLYYLAVNNYDPDQGESWVSLKNRLGDFLRTISENRELKLNADYIEVVLFTNITSYSRDLMRKGKNGRADYPVFDENDNGIYMGKVEYFFERSCAEFHCEFNTSFYRTFTDENGRKFSGNKICIR